MGTVYEQNKEIAYIFDTADSEAFLKPHLIHKYSEDADGNHSIYKPLTPYGKRIRAIPEEWTNNFGKQYYLHERSWDELNSQSESDWKLRLEGQLTDTGNKINVTDFDELRTYIKQELGEFFTQEVCYDE